MLKILAEIGVPDAPAKSPDNLIMARPLILGDF